MFGIGQRVVRWRVITLAVSASVALLVSLALSSGVEADTSVTVSSSCTLAKAVLYADGTAESACSTATPSGATTINLPAGSYTVTGTLQLSRNTTIKGAGASITTISGGNAVRIFVVAANVQAAISDVTLTKGEPPVPSSCGNATCPPEAGNDGGAVLNDGTLSLSSVVLTGNAASTGLVGYGGADLCTNGCPSAVGQPGGAGGDGGAVANEGTLNVAGSTFSGNKAGAGTGGSGGASGSGSYDSAGQSGGNGGAGGAGGAIYNASNGTATITGSTFSTNFAGAGGGGGGGSTATLNNAAGGSGGSGGAGGAGGAIANAGTLTVTASALVSGGTGVGGGGGGGAMGLGSGGVGISGAGGVGGSGGAVAALGTATVDTTGLINDTIATNSTAAGGSGFLLTRIAGNGAGLYTSSHAALTLSFVTLAGNANYGTYVADGSGIYINGGSVSEANSIVAGNGSGVQANCDGATVIDGGHNVAYDAGASGGCPGLVGDPKLAVLAGNGGPTQTMALQAGSSALALVPAASCSGTTDQRGVSRPQAGACDAGAYELAPPAMSAAAASSSDLVTASINPNLQDTSVTVKYGASTAYGSTTTAKDIGSGDAAVAVSLPLSGLTVGSTYHAEIIATNHDGTTTSSDLSMTANTTSGVAGVTGAHVKLIKLSTSGKTLKLKLSCAGASGQKCKVNVAVTVLETLHGQRVTAIAADAHKKAKTKTVTIGKKSFSLNNGSTKTVSLKLNASGQKLLRGHKKLPAHVAITGTSKLGKRATFIRPKPKKRK